MARGPLDPSPTPSLQIQTGNLVLTFAIVSELSTLKKSLLYFDEMYYYRGVAEITMSTANSSILILGHHISGFCGQVILNGD